MYALETWAIPDWPFFLGVIFVGSIFSFLGWMLSSAFRDKRNFNWIDTVAAFVVFCICFFGLFHISYSSAIDRYNFWVTVTQDEITATEKRYARVTRECENEDQFVEKTNKKYLVHVYECNPYQEALRLELIDLQEDLAYLIEHHVYRD
jgi:hypothetical protein